MGVLSDLEITRLSTEGFDIGGEHKLMITPFAEGKNRPGKLSYGATSYGYDFRISSEFQIFTPGPDGVIDPKNFDASICEEVDAGADGYVDIPPYSFALAATVERFCIPRTLITLCVGKSTYARCALFLNITPFEPEWEGHATIEMANPTARPIRVYANEGAGQLIFLQAGSDEEGVQLVCGTSYADKRGKYQHQEARVVTARVETEQPK